jgi:hypothetical protein
VIEVSSLHDDVVTKEEFKYSHEVEVSVAYLLMQLSAQV